MPKKITYFVQGYNPKIEAISKEVEILAKNFDGKIFDLATTFKYGLDTKKISVYYKLYPLAFLLMKLADKKEKISHIYASLGDFPYLTFLTKRPIIITGISLPPKERIKSSIKKLKKVDKIIVECERDQKKLIQWGITQKNIQLIYPGINLNQFNYKNANGGFKILFASSPMREQDFEKKGVITILETAKKMEDIIFVIAWRNILYEKINKLIKEKNLKNIILINKNIEKMQEMYSETNATIIPYTQENDKSCPLSIIESLASGKPVIVSDKVGVSKLIIKEKCGVVFKNPENLSMAIKELKKNYNKYQKNCIKTAQKYFSIERFINQYKEVYKEL